MPEEDAVDHPRPPHPLALLTLVILSSIRIVVDDVASIGTHESGASSYVELWAQHVRVPHLRLKWLELQLEGPISFTWSTSGDGENFCGTLVSPQITCKLLCNKIFSFSIGFMLPVIK